MICIIIVNILTISKVQNVTHACTAMWWTVKWGPEYKSCLTAAELCIIIMYNVHVLKGDFCIFNLYPKLCWVCVIVYVNNIPKVCVIFFYCRILVSWSWVEVTRTLSFFFTLWAVGPRLTMSPSRPASSSTMPCWRREYWTQTARCWPYSHHPWCTLDQLR